MTQVKKIRTHANAFAGNASTHCVFRRGPLWLALPAVSVREAMPRPEMVFVPGTPGTFVGLCHVRSEFVPVLNLDSMLSVNRESADQILLILDDIDGPWGVLVDEVSSLLPLEVSDAPDAEEWHSESVVVGWATYRNSVIQVLDQTRMRRIAEQELSDIWQNANTHSQSEVNSELPESKKL